MRFVRLNCLGVDGIKLSAVVLVIWARGMDCLGALYLVSWMLDWLSEALSMPCLTLLIVRALVTPFLKVG